MFVEASMVGNQTRIKQRKTATGIKDTFLESFLDCLAQSYSKIRGGNNAKQEALDRVKETLLANVISPVWRVKGLSICFNQSHVGIDFIDISGLDPHTDTPVEILHTVLLGLVKYFWRDAISIRIGQNQLKHELLETRLSSVDVAGLGISHLNGRTLVQYAGSLVGCDFRAIAQIAPFVLHDLVPKDCYDAWVALSNLMPLVWQPEIDNCADHLVGVTFRLCCSSHTQAKFNRIILQSLSTTFLHAPLHGPLDGSTN
jgi:hypothetical protein